MKQTSWEATRPRIDDDTRTGLYINGSWRDGPDKLDVTNPATGEVIATVSAGGPVEAVQALDSAAAAQASWGTTGPRARADLFHRAHRILIERKDVFVHTMTSESGKPLAEAASEFELSAGFFLWYAEQIAHLHGTYARGSSGGYRILTTHQPIGPTLLVTPWNFPLLMVARKAGAALAAGCTIVVKSAKETPVTCSLFMDVLHEAGFPKGSVNLIHTSNSAPVSATLMADARLRKVSFTGSTGVGSTLLEQAAPGIVNASMELGGDGPFIVLDDADVDLAVEQAVSCKFRNAGQACVAANRIIVDDSVADEFTEKFLARTRELKVGDGFEADTDVGPMISAKQRDHVIELVREISKTDSTMLMGGKPVPGKGFFFEPTVFEMFDRSAAVCNVELFAPIATIYRVSSGNEALEFANDTMYGLAAYVFTRDITRAVRFSEKLDFGMVGINRGTMADPAAPFGGVKASGLGREGGHDGIYEFLEPKYLALTVDEDGGF